jgi:exosortase
MNAQPVPRETDPRLVKLLFLATILLFLPTWLWLIEAWLSHPYYSHGPLVILVSLYFAWARRIHASDMPLFKPTLLGWVVLVAALAVHLWVTLWRAYYLSALTIPFAFGGLLLVLYGWRITQRFGFALAFLFLMVPLPIVERLGPPLESWAASSATALAQWFGVAARNEGAQVYLLNSMFTVGFACSGLRSVVAIVALAALLAYIVQGHTGARVVLFLVAIPIALAANTLRLALLFAIASVWGSDAAMNYFHDWSSLVLFLCAFALLIALAQLLRCSTIRWEAIVP